MIPKVADFSDQITLKIEDLGIRFDVKRWRSDRAFHSLFRYLGFLPPRGYNRANIRTFNSL
jgi:hypothetical protein